MNTALKLASALALGLSLAACQTTTGQTMTGQSTATPTAEMPDAGAQEAALKARVDAFNRAFMKEDYDTVISTMPPRLLSLLAKRMGFSNANLRKLLVETTANVMSKATVHSFSMNVPAGSIKKSGAISYALLPTRTDLTVLGSRSKTDTTTVAIMDSGTWYLVRVDSAQNEADVKTAYPELKSVKLR